MGGPGGPVVNEEESALESITPGHLIMLTATGVQKNTAAAENVAPQFALERDELGKEIGPGGTGEAGVAEYAVGDKVKAATYSSGMRVYAFLASGQNVVKGAYLTGTATGLLTATGVAADIRTARALESVNSTSDTTRIRVEIV
jgi:hypothetical protein